MTFSPETLRRELLPTTQLEELFFDMIARLSTCAHFLGLHIDKDPDFINTETPRRMRLLLSTESKLRYAYEEFRRLKLARQLQNEDVALASRPTLTVVATHTTRNGLRKPVRPESASRASAASRAPEAPEARVSASAPIAHPATPPRAGAASKPPAGRNAPCPCNSGRKYKHCCLNRTPSVSEGIVRAA